MFKSTLSQKITFSTVGLCVCYQHSAKVKKEKNNNNIHIWHSKFVLYGDAILNYFIKIGEIICAKECTKMIRIHYSL